MKCYCDLAQAFDNCCEPFLQGKELAPDPVSLMRSRYSAFATGEVDYLKQTWHPNFVPVDLTIEPDQKWIGLKIIETRSDGDHGEVKFVARYKIAGKAHRLEEHSLFSRIDGRWYYLHPKT